MAANLSWLHSGGDSRMLGDLSTVLVGWSAYHGIVDTELGKVNAVLQYSVGVANDGLSTTATGYKGRRNVTTDQPLRAMDERLISSGGSLEPTGEKRKRSA